MVESEKKRPLVDLPLVCLDGRSTTADWKSRSQYDAEQASNKGRKCGPPSSYLSLRKKRCPQHLLQTLCLVLVDLLVSQTPKPFNSRCSRIIPVSSLPRRTTPKGESFHQKNLPSRSPHRRRTRARERTSFRSHSHAGSTFYWPNQAPMVPLVLKCWARPRKYRNP